MSRVLKSVGVAVLAIALAGCAATGTSGPGSTSVGLSAGSSAAASASASASASTDALPTAQSSAVPTAADGSDGWYDTWGWVSPQTAERALAAGIAAGKDVRDKLRCGVACGESPTAAEIQAQYLLDHPDNPNASIEAYEAAAAACPGYFIRGNCYADAEAAKAAGEGE